MFMVPSAYSNTPRSVHLLIDSKLCISSCKIATNMGRHQQWEVFFIYSRSTSDVKQTYKTYALSVRSLQYGLTVCFRCSDNVMTLTMVGGYSSHLVHSEKGSILLLQFSMFLPVCCSALPELRTL